MCEMCPVPNVPKFIPIHPTWMGLVTMLNMKAKLNYNGPINNWIEGPKKYKLYYNWPNYKGPLL